MDPNLCEWIMEYSEVLRFSLEGRDETEFEEYFADKQADLSDLDAIRRGVREPRLWHVCNFYGLEPFIPEFLGLYLSDLRNMRRWNNIENIDVILLTTLELELGPDSKDKLATEWLIDLIQYNRRPYSDISISEGLEFEHLKETFAIAYTWSFELLNFALCSMKVDSVLATYIYCCAASRGLLDLMHFAHTKGARGGHVECMRVAQQLGGSIGDSYRCARWRGNHECIELVYLLISETDPDTELQRRAAVSKIPNRIQPTAP